MPLTKTIFSRSALSSSFIDKAGSSVSASFHTRGASALSSSFIGKTGAAVSGTFATRASVSSSLTQGNESVQFDQVTGSTALFTGRMTGGEVFTQYVSSSVLVESSGSTKLGNQHTDLHSVTGSMSILSGSLVLEGSGSVGVMVSGSASSTGSFGQGYISGDLRVDNRIGINIAPDAFLTIQTDSDGTNAIQANDHDGNGLFRLRDSSAAALMNLYDGGVDKLALDADGVSYFLGGNVGIGTSAPAGLLELTTDTDDTLLYLTAHHDTNSAHSNIMFRKSGGSRSSPTTVADNEFLGDIEWHGYDGDSYGQSAIIRCEIDGTPGDGDVPGALVFLTTPDGAQASSERMRIDDAGNVGIGTASPSATFNVSSSSYIIADFWSSHATENDIRIGGSSNANDSLVVGFNRTGDYGFIQVLGDAVGSSIVITDGGNVGIGTSAPQIPTATSVKHKLQVSGSRFGIVGNGVNQDWFDAGGGSNDKWLNLNVDGGIAKFGVLHDDAGDWTANDLLRMDMGSGYAAFAGAADVRLTLGSEGSVGENT